MADNEAKMVTLICSDGEVFMVSEAVAKQSQAITYAIDEDCIQSAIPVPNVDSRILSMVIKYMNKHASEEGSSAQNSEEELKRFDAEFVDTDVDTLYYLIMAAHYLDLESLLNLTCQKVADMIKGKQPEEIRKIYGINNDLSPEEEQEIRRQYAWAFEH